MLQFHHSPFKLSYNPLRSSFFKTFSGPKINFGTFKGAFGHLFFGIKTN